MAEKHVFMETGLDWYVLNGNNICNLEVMSPILFNE